MVTKHNAPQPKPQDHVKHPQPWDAALSPNRGAGETPGSVQPRTRPASEIKQVTRALTDFTMDELREIPVIEAGSQLREGAVYIDLGTQDRGEFKATSGLVAAPGSYYVAKHDVPYPHWNKLLERGARVERNTETRHIEQGSNELRGGRERSERRGGEAVATGDAKGSPRQH